MHGGASGVDGAAELGMEALEPARSANKGMMREHIVRSAERRVPNGRVRKGALTPSNLQRGTLKPSATAVWAPEGRDERSGATRGSCSLVIEGHCSLSHPGATAALACGNSFIWHAVSRWMTNRTRGSSGHTPHGRAVIIKTTKKGDGGSEIVSPSTYLSLFTALVTWLLSVHPSRLACVLCVDSLASRERVETGGERCVHRIKCGPFFCQKLENLVGSYQLS